MICFAAAANEVAVANGGEDGSAGKKKKNAQKMDAGGSHEKGGQKQSKKVCARWPWS